MNKIVSIVITATLILTGAMQANMLEELKQKQLQEKYEDAFKRQKALDQNPDYLKKFKKIKEIHKNELKALQAKYKTSPPNIHDQENKIREQYKHAFEKEQEMYNNPEYLKETTKAKEVSVAEFNKILDKIKKKYNPYYDELQKANQEIQEIQENFWAQKNAVANNKAYQTEMQALDDKTASSVNNLLGEYDPELQKINKEITEFIKKHHQNSLNTYY